MARRFPHSFSEVYPLPTEVGKAGFDFLALVLTQFADDYFFRLQGKLVHHVADFQGHEVAGLCNGLRRPPLARTETLARRAPRERVAVVGAVLHMLTIAQVRTLPDEFTHYAVDLVGTGLTNILPGTGTSFTNHRRRLLPSKGDALWRIFLSVALVPMLNQQPHSLLALQCLPVVQHPALLYEP